MKKKPFLKTCKGCGLSYTEVDTRTHNFQHRRWAAACEKFGRIRVHGEREAVKRDAGGVLYSDAEVGEKVIAMIAYVRAHFDRSVANDGFRNFKRHPDFETYAAAYDVSHFGVPEVAAAFRERFPVRLSSRLQSGFTYWK